MDVNLITEAEKQAELAAKLPAFLGVNLFNIKQNVATLLSFIGREGIFSQYTKHDITHADEMLKILDWLIPQKTKMAMSPADWLLIVLSIYFHDLGMLVTKKEFDQRNLSEFPQYRDKILLGESYKDYRTKIEQFYQQPEDIERFLYQEFVRENHAKRIGIWIRGKASDELGISEDALREVRNLLEPLNWLFRRDLALVCESHHLDDLYDIKKYKVSQPYRNSDEETANVQYASAILRTVDLLHITNDRVPSITYRVINPTDPISQEEWAKQAAVTRVKAQIGRDKEGNIDEKAHSDTIEVYANFTQENGFFGLISYLSYVKLELRKTYEWIKISQRTYGDKYNFPWNNVDDSNVETEGFIPNTFKFDIDQEKILDLLTGHTLYNNTDVVIREVVQNSLDAIRLHRFQTIGSFIGKIEIHWESKRRILTIKDNGTGMTQQIIEKHLLKVGSSRYQDPDFQKQYPDFASISRFGIGVLSTFMVADSVEITTCHPEETEIRQLSLRSVHGRYLIRLIDKHSREISSDLIPHGTIVKLTIRPSVEMPNVLETAKKWIVVPGCEVLVKIDNNPPVKVGYGSPQEALIYGLENFDSSWEKSDSAIWETESSSKTRVVQKELDGITVAYVLKWSKYWNYWNFVTPDEDLVPSEKLSVGICIEGIRINFDTPGYKGLTIWALANVTGKDAPKTNVARSGLELNDKLNNTLEKIYKIYCQQIDEEMQEMQKKLLSLTWALQEVPFLLSPVMNTSEKNKPINEKLLRENIRNIPLLMIEHNGQRYAETPAKFSTHPCFWTIDCGFFYSAEWLLREAPGNSSLNTLIAALDITNFPIPEEPIYREGNLWTDLPTEEFVFNENEVNKIIIYRDQRRLDLRWMKHDKQPKWLKSDPEKLTDEEKRMWLRMNSFIALRSTKRKLHICLEEIEIIGAEESEIGVETEGQIYIFPANEVANYFVSYSEKNMVSKNDIKRSSRNLLMLVFAIMLGESRYSFPDNRVESMLRYAMHSENISSDEYFSVNDLYALVKRAELFVPSHWRRF